MICEKCNKVSDDIYGSGRFCSEKCARGFSTSTNRSMINSKVSMSLKGRKETISIKKCEYCFNEFTSLKRKHRRFCSKRCAALSKGPPKGTYDKYKRECQFRFSLSDYPTKFDFSLIRKHGWYSAKNRGNNINGISRDHIISIRWGWEHGVDPKYISHPANCQLLLQRKNVSKGKKESISIDELKHRIDGWNKILDTDSNQIKKSILNY